MAKEWYDMIALKNKGYKSHSVYTIEGLSGETVFEERLIQQLQQSHSVLDAGCGDGEFTLSMGRHTEKLIGFDNSEELLKLAKANLEKSALKHVEFVYGWTNEQKGLPFEEASFDLIYVRRGPTSILKHKRLLKPGGVIMGIHSAELERVQTRLEENGFTEIDIEIFDEAVAVFPNETELLKYFSAFPGHPDYFLPENKDEAKALVERSLVDGRLIHKQWRYLWRAVNGGA